MAVHMSTQKIYIYVVPITVMLNATVLFKSNFVSNTYNISINTTGRDCSKLNANVFICY